MTKDEQDALVQRYADFIKAFGDRRTVEVPEAAGIPLEMIDRLCLLCMAYERQWQALEETGKPDADAMALAQDVPTMCPVEVVEHILANLANISGAA
jgi:hypothetical protein